MTEVQAGPHRLLLRLGDGDGALDRRLLIGDGGLESRLLGLLLGRDDGGRGDDAATP